MPLDPESLYMQLGRLVEEMPDLWQAQYTADTQRWLGRAVALVEQIGNPADIAMLKVAAANVHSIATKPNNIQTIISVVYSALARAELQAPMAAQGSFIPAGHAFDAAAAVGKVVTGAKNNVLIVDPYLDEKVLTDFAVLAQPDVLVRLLADANDVKPSLAPMAVRWLQQHGAIRPLEVRLASARSLHDRLIIVDDRDTWTLTQSLNGLATRSPASIIRASADIASLKVAAYQSIWQASTSL